MAAMCGTILTEQQAVHGERVTTSRALWVALAVTAIMTVARLSGTVDSDVAWQLWIAGRLHAGARLYRDIIEVNPPLWFWMALPIDRVADWLHVRIEAVLAVAMGCYAAVSLAATDRFLTSLAPRRRTMLLAFAALALLGIPWVHLGQREQIVLIGTLPYAALIAARRQRLPVSTGLALLIGIIAAAGFALKHYFLIVPGLLELWLISGQGRAWSWRRPEVMALVGFGLLYAAAFLLLARDFFTVVVPLVQLSYGLLGAPSVLHLFGPFAVAGLILLCVLGGHVKVLRAEAPLASALFVASIAFAGIYFIQAKGWVYHSIPLLGCTSLAIAALLVESDASMRFLRLAAPALLALPLFLTAEEQLHPSLPSPDLNGAIAGIRPGESVGFLAVETAVPWSVTLQHKFRNPWRYMGHWMLGAIVRNEQQGNPDPRLTALGRQIVSETVQDFACAPPTRIIVSRPQPGQAGYDIMTFFMRDPRFVEMLSHYRVRSRTSFETYERVSSLAPPADSCRHGV